MSLRRRTTIDELLGDSLIQAVMRADRVEPQALKTLLVSAAARLAAPSRDGTEAAGDLSVRAPPIGRRAPLRSTVAPARPPFRPRSDGCGSAFRC